MAKQRDVESKLKAKTNFGDYKFLRHGHSGDSGLENTMKVPLSMIEKYYDVPRTDSEGYYKSWVMGTEQLYATRSIKHFAPFSATNVTSLPVNRPPMSAPISPL